MTFMLLRLDAWALSDAAAVEVDSWEHGHTNLGGILAPAKTVKPQALPAPVILAAGAATRDEAASDTPRPNARDLPEACPVSQSRNSDASFLTANPGGVAIAEPAAAASSTASVPAGPSNMRLKTCSVPTHVRMNASPWSLTWKLRELRCI